MILVWGLAQINEAKATFITGTLTSTIELKLNEETSIRELDQEETYKYLVIDKGDRIQHVKLKKRSAKSAIDEQQLFFTLN